MCAAWPQTRWIRVARCALVCRQTVAARAASRVALDRPLHPMPVVCHACRPCRRRIRGWGRRIEAAKSQSYSSEAWARSHSRSTCREIPAHTANPAVAKQVTMAYTNLLVPDPHARAPVFASAEPAESLSRHGHSKARPPGHLLPTAAPLQLPAAGHRDFCGRLSPAAASRIWAAMGWRKSPLLFTYCSPDPDWGSLDPGPEDSDQAFLGHLWPSLFAETSELVRRR